MEPKENELLIDLIDDLIQAILNRERQKSFEPSIIADKPAMKFTAEEVLDILNNCAEYGDFGSNFAKIIAICEQFDIPKNIIKCFNDADDLTAFAAAVFYFYYDDKTTAADMQLALKKAVSTIYSGDYQFYDVDSEFDLGVEVFNVITNGKLPYEWQVLADFIDYEALGNAIKKRFNGTFYFGFFAPSKLTW